VEIAQKLLGKDSSKSAATMAGTTKKSFVKKKNIMLGK